MIKNLRRSVAEGGKIKIGGKAEARLARDGVTMWAPGVKYNHL